MSVRRIKTVRKIEANELSLEDFRYYGTYNNMLEAGNLRVGEERSNEFYPDLVLLNLPTSLPIAGSVARVSKCERIIRFAEFHNFTGEGILPLDGDCIIYVGKAGRNIDVNGLKAFRIPQGTFVSLHPGTVHGCQFTYNTDVVHVLIVLPQRTYKNDCEFVRIPDEDQILID